MARKPPPKKTSKAKPKKAPLKQRPAKRKAKAPAKPRSAFDELGIKKSVDHLVEEITELYLGDEIPWVVGYSGGKDSTATLQLVWLALQRLKPAQRKKPVHVISTDTLVENPVVSAWVRRSLEHMDQASKDQGLPLTPRQLTPEVTDTFWVNLIGKGYPAPRHKFRWCTERMKIKPSNAFIMDVVRENGEAILVLGTRKAESQKRAKVMKDLEKDRLRGRLSPNLSLPNSLVFSPIEEWTNDDVWLFLMQMKNPWGYNNHDLLAMYSGASADGECPLVVDTTTPSCGNSRFGCWVCTLVEEDKSMQAMIQNDEEKEWMLPLLEIRNELDNHDDRDLRDFRRKTGHLHLFHDRLVHGPYTQESREHWLRRVLTAQKWVQINGPPEVRDLELVTLPELHEIRRIWVVEKHEIEDNLPAIYEEALDAPFPGGSLDDNQVFRREELDLLQEVCDGDRLRYELLRELLHVEQQYRGMARRAGLYDQLESALKRHSYDDAEDATDRMRRERSARDAAQDGEFEKLQKKLFDSGEGLPV